MNPYKYTISFRVRHPTSNLKMEYEKLAAIPGALKGELKEVRTERKDPRGKSIGGVYTHSLFRFSFMDKWLISTSESLENSLSIFIDKLAPYKDILQNVVNTGGELEFFIGISINENSSIVLNPSLLKKLAKLDIEVDFDLYPSDKLRHEFQSSH